MFGRVNFFILKEVEKVAAYHMHKKAVYVCCVHILSKKLQRNITMFYFTSNSFLPESPAPHICINAISNDNGNHNEVKHLRNI